MEALHPSLGRLGPDLLAPEFDADEAIRRLRDPEPGRTPDRRRPARSARAGRDRQRVQERIALDRARGTIRHGRRCRRRDARPAGGQRPAAARCQRGPDRQRRGWGADHDRRRPWCARAAVCLRPDRPPVPALPDQDRERHPRASTSRAGRTGVRSARRRRHPASRVSSRPMCEHFIARAAAPFRLDELWPFVEKLERFGIAGFGWGAAWLADDNGHGLGSYRDVRAFRDDPGREQRRRDPRRPRR